MAEIQTQNSFGSTLTGVANLAQLFLGNSQTTGGTTTTDDNRTQSTTTSGGTNTTTTQQSVPPGAVDAVVASILQGTNGLAAVAGGQRTAGLYNSSTNQMLTGDLVARAAAEGAKLNQTTTTTAVTAPTTSTTRLSGGTTTNQTQDTTKKAAVDPKLALGGLALLQAIPKNVKDSILSGLLGKKGAATADTVGATGDTGQSAIEAAYNDPSRALDIAPGSSAAADGVAAVGGIAGGGTPSIDGLSIDAASGMGDDLSSFGGDELGNFLQANDNFAGVDVGSDTLNELGSGIGDSLGGFLSGIGDSASNFASSVGSFFDDFDFSFADGGMVSSASKADQMSAHFSKKLEEYYSTKTPQPKGYANGGSVKRDDPMYDIDSRDLTSLVNTGLRPADLQKVATRAVAGNDPTLSRMISDSVRGGEVLPKIGTTAGAGQNDNRSGANTSAHSRGNGLAVDTSNPDAAGISVSEGQGIGSVSGIANAIGVSPAVGQAGITGLTGLMGLAAPGLSGLANASNNQSAVNGFISSIVGLANPVAGLIVSALLANMNSGTGANGGVSGASQGEGPTSATVSVGDVSDSATGQATANAPGITGATSTTGIGSTGGGGDSSGAASAGNAGTGSAGDDGGGDGSGPGGGGGAGSGAGPGFKTGGPVDGPGTGTSDSILARLSDGEYIIPADVVAAKGESFFDALLAQHHTPTAARA